MGGGGGRSEEALLSHVSDSVCVCVCGGGGGLSRGRYHHVSDSVAGGVVEGA